MPQYNFTSAQRILVESTSSVSTKCDLIWEGTNKPTEGKYIIYCGKKYIESKTNDTIDFLDIYGEEYKLTYTDTKKEYAYIEFYNDIKKIAVRKSDGEGGIKALRNIASKSIKGGVVKISLSSDEIKMALSEIIPIYPDKNIASDIMFSENFFTKSFRKVSFVMVSRLFF